MSLLSSTHLSASGPLLQPLIRVAGYKNPAVLANDEGQAGRRPDLGKILSEALQQLDEVYSGYRKGSTICMRLLEIG